MRPGSFIDLLAIVSLCFLLGLFVFLVPVQPLQAILGGFFLFFAPGYTFLAAVYPARGELGTGERIFGSVGASIVLVGLITLAVHYLTGFTKFSVFFLVSLAIVLFSATAIYNRWGLPDSKQWNVSAARRKFAGAIPGLPKFAPIDGTRYLMLALVVLAMVGFLSAGRHSSPGYTEFYLFGQDSKLADYTLELQQNEALPIRVGVIQHEGKATTYHLAYCIEADCETVSSFQLSDGEKWEQELHIRFPVDLGSGVHQVTFVLDPARGDRRADRLHVWVKLAAERP